MFYTFRGRDIKAIKMNKFPDMPVYERSNAEAEASTRKKGKNGILYEEPVLPRASRNDNQSDSSRHNWLLERLANVDETIEMPRLINLQTQLELNAKSDDSSTNSPMKK